MFRCPTCGAACGDEDVFCEACGKKVGKSANPAVLPATARRSSTPSMPAVAVTPDPCAACNAVGSDDGEGYCNKCGAKLGAALSLSLLPTAPPEAATPAEGAMIGGYRVERAASRADSIAVNDRGEEALIVLGEPLSLACEAEALELFAKGDGENRLPITLPLVIAERLDGRPPHLALSPPTKSSRKLWDAAPEVAVDRGIDFMEAVLTVVEKMERAGFKFAPAPTDFVLDGDALGLMRLRDTKRLAPNERLDAKAVLDAAGECLLPEPAVRAVPRFVRAIAPSRETYEGKKPTLEDLRSEIAKAREEMAAPIPEGNVAELCDAGLWRPYQQDATALAHGTTEEGEAWTVLVVCDGVSSSPVSHRASRGAAKAACEALSHFARSRDLGKESPTSAVAQAIRAAHLLVCTAHYAEPSPTPPGTTIVVALVHRRRATIGWVGDSRAYWCTSSGAEALTRDHSWVNEALARGEIQSEDDVEGALAHTITKCLGPLEVGDIPIEIEPDVKTRDLATPGTLVLCSDGLWNYAPKIADLDVVLRAAEGLNAAGLARFLVSYALARGGQDNVSVAIYRQES